MLANFLIVAHQVAVLFVLAGVGAACRWMRLLDEFSVRGIVNVLLFAITPAIVIDCFRRPFDAELLEQLALAFVIAALMHLFMIAVATALLHGKRSRVSVLRTAAVFSNAGFIGIPLEQAVLGSEGVFFGVIYITVFNLFVWSFGMRMMSGTGLRWRSMVLNPGTVGVAMGLPLFLFSLKMPSVVGVPIHCLAEINTPLAMIVIGYYLADSGFVGVFRQPSAFAVAGLRLVAFPLVLVWALWMFGAEFNRTMKLALVTASAAPVAAMVAMFATKCGCDIDLSVGLVSGTTLASVVSLPVVIAIAMAVL